MSEPTKQLIVLTDDGWKPAIQGEAEKQKQELIVLAKTVQDVLDKDTKEIAVHVASQLKGLLRLCETSRKEAVEPLNLEHDRIQEIAREFSKELNAEAKRIEGMIGSYVAEEQRKADELRRAQELERQQAERARQDALRAQQEAEEARRRAEEAKGKAAKAAADKLAKAAEETARQASLSAAHATVSVAEQKTVVTDVKATGAVVKPTYEVQIVDADALYRARPECVTLTPNLISIRALIAMGVTNIPGVKLTEVIKVSVKAAPSTLKLN